MTFEELRDQATELYESRLDVHSETNFAALLAAFEIFKPYIAPQKQEGESRTTHFERVGKLGQEGECCERGNFNDGHECLKAAPEPTNECNRCIREICICAAS